jgi:hypothetical protein
VSGEFARWKCVCFHGPCDGLDCGVYLPGRAPRKKAAPKSPDDLTNARAKAWETRRAKYGQRGHGSSYSRGTA